MFHAFGSRSVRDLERIAETVDQFIREHVPDGRSRSGGGDQAGAMEIATYAQEMGLNQTGLMALWRQWKRGGDLQDQSKWAKGLKRITKRDA